MIYVAGGTSFLGKKVVEILLAEGKQLRCLYRTETARLKLMALRGDIEGRLNLAEGNMSSPDSLYYGLNGIDIAVYMIRLEYTQFVKNFLDAALKCGLKRVVFISSTTTMLPTENKFKAMKLESEELIKKSGINYTILRPTMIYGGKEDNNFFKMLNFIKKKGFFVIFGNGKNLIQPVHVDDVAKAVTDVLDDPATFNKTYVICGRNAIQYNEMLQTVRNLLGKNFRIIKLPINASKFAVNIYKKIVKKSDFNSDQIERMRIDKAYSYEDASRDFGFDPMSFREGIKKEIIDGGF
ncbi:MAG: SDR family oxidoreductase [Candidatus Humimicrobiaceae bacterium]